MPVSPHRARAAFLAISFRRFLDSERALAGPPFRPPRRPRILAASCRRAWSSGAPPLSSPVARAAMRWAAWFSSSRRVFERSGIRRMVAQQRVVGKRVGLSKPGGEVKVKILWLVGSFLVGTVIYTIARSLQPGSPGRIALVVLGAGLIFWVWFVKPSTRIRGGRKDDTPKISN